MAHLGREGVTPAKFAATFDDVIKFLPPEARVLGCPCGTGQLAVGLAGLGMRVVAADASAAMVRRTEDLAEEFGMALRTARACWDELPDHFEEASFDAATGPDISPSECARGDGKDFASVS